MHASSKVSIVIPTKNRCELLAETLESVRSQTYDNWEAIVVDDGSSDLTAELVHQINRQDCRITFQKRTDGRHGAPACRNQGFRRSTGDFVIFLDSDDLLAPNCIADRLASAHDTCDVVVGIAGTFIRHPGDRRFLFNMHAPGQEIDRLLNLDHPWQTASAMWRRTWIDQIGGWDTRLLSWQDWELHMRSLCAGVVIQYSHLVDMFFRVEVNPSRISTSQFKAVNHLLRTSYLWKKTRAMLQASSFFCTSRRNKLAALILARTIEPLLVQAQPIFAASIWQRERSWIPTQAWLAGRSAIDLARVPKIRRFTWTAALPIAYHLLGGKPDCGTSSQVNPDQLQLGGG